MELKVISFIQRAYTDFYVYDALTKDIIAMSLLSPRDNVIKSVLASIKLGDKGRVFETDNVNHSDLSIVKNYAFEPNKGGFCPSKIERIENSKQRFYYTILTNNQLVDIEKGKYFVSFVEPSKDLFNKLMNMFGLPLKEEWAEFILHGLKSRNHLQKMEMWTGENCSPELKNASFFKLNISEAEFETFISDSLNSGQICICESEQIPLTFNNLDEYFTQYGNALVNEIESQINPLVPYNPKSRIILKNKKLFPKQAQMVNAMSETLKHANFSCCIAEMGCGKTILGGSTVEDNSQSKLRKVTSSIVEINQKTNYRTMVMCPSHLLKKWAREVKDEIPAVKVTILTSIDQVLKLSKEVKEPAKGKNFYILSKDFAKLDYQVKPAVRKWGKKRVRIVSCKNCSNTSMTLHEYYTNGKVCTECGEKALEVIDAKKFETGWICPCCGEVLYPYTEKLKKKKDNDSSDDEPEEPLDAHAFIGEQLRNSKCNRCGAELWEPNIFNYDETGGETKSKLWTRISYWRNGQKKTTKTVWVYKEFLSSYLMTNRISEDSWSYVRECKSRKISPAQFIKSQFPRNAFNYLIADEAHMFKAGGSAQANAFHALIKKSRKQIILTGTLLGGVASDIFYLMYRLNPRMMKKEGFEYTDVLSFSEMYGVVERGYVYDSKDEFYNTGSKGRPLGPPRVKPGISPLIYSKFLLENSVFLALNQLSSFLPKFTEKTVRVNMTDEMEGSYNEAKNFFKSALRTKEGGKLMSSMLQTLLSYPDKLEGYEPIRSPLSGEVMYNVKNLPTDILYPKEEALVKIINEELEQGRKCVVFSIYSGESGDKDTLPRLKSVIEDNCGLKGKVDILRANTCKAIDREGWLENSVEQGSKVVICNPKLVETGLDLLDHPTLIFYSTGYSLFTIWQASRRAYRLNQKNECKVFYLAYLQTLQDDCLQIMASKKVATAAIQGSFSSEGLAAMAQGVDPQVLLAKSLFEGSTAVSDEKMQEMFKTINIANNSASEISEEEKAFLEELRNSNIKEILSQLELAEDDNILDVFNMFGQMETVNEPTQSTLNCTTEVNNEVKEEKAKDSRTITKSSGTYDLLKDFFGILDVNFNSLESNEEHITIEISNSPKRKSKTSRVAEGTVPLFDF